MGPFQPSKNRDEFMKAYPEVVREVTLADGSTIVNVRHDFTYDEGQKIGVYGYELRLSRGPAGWRIISDHVAYQS